METDIFTIGYTGFKIDEFIDVLKIYKVNAVVDVRSYPFSKYYSDYNSDTLENTLKKSDISYRLYDKEFGARQKDYALYDENNQFDLTLFSKSEQFKRGMKRIKKGTSSGFRIALMCAEKNPIECHRAVLVGRELSLVGFNVLHIINKNKIITEKQLEEELVDIYFPEKDQLSLFNNDNLSLSKQIQKSIEMQRKKIAYHEKELLNE